MKTMRLLPFLFNLIIGTFAAKKYISDDEDLGDGSGDRGSGDYEEGSGGWDTEDPTDVGVAIIDTTWLIIGAGALTAVIVICSIIYCCCIKKKDQDSYEFSSGQTREMA